MLLSRLPTQDCVLSSAGDSMTNVNYPLVVPEVLVALWWLDQTATISSHDLSIFKVYRATTYLTSTELIRVTGRRIDLRRCHLDSVHWPSCGRILRIDL